MNTLTKILGFWAETQPSNERVMTVVAALARAWIIRGRATAATSNRIFISRTIPNLNDLVALLALTILLSPGLRVAFAAEGIQSEIIFGGADLNGWRQPHGEWQVAGGVVLDAARPEAFAISPGTGMMVNGAAGRTCDLMTEAEFGDVDLHVEFCIARHSNSGIYLQGRYEVQIYDSHGVAKDAYPGIECGGIYARWINEQNVDGHSPRVNASKPAGDWQTFDILFRAPRFDAGGQKIANAQMVCVKHNGQVVHEKVELKGPTRSAHWTDEKALGPILLQGDHGPVAYRNLRVKRINLGEFHGRDASPSSP